MKNELVRWEDSRAIVDLEKGKALIASARNADDLKAIKDQAGAVKAYLRQRGGALETMNDAGEIVIRATVRLGREVAAMPKHNGDPRCRDGTTPPPATLDELGINGKQSERWQKVGSVPDDAVEAFLTGCRDLGEEITTAGMLRIAGGGKVAANFSSESVEWYTPDKYIDAARAVMGSIDLDPASSTKANEVVKAVKFFSAKENGLARKWCGNIWLNPPYGELDGVSQAGAWAEKLAEEVDASRVNAAILLLNNVADRGWFEPVWLAAAICWTDHRIQFYTPDAHPRSPVMGSVFAYYGSATKKFVSEFSAFGHCAIPVIP